MSTELQGAHASWQTVVQGWIIHGAFRDFRPRCPRILLEHWSGMAGLAGVGLGMQKETSAVPMEGRLQARPMGDENEHEWTKGTMSGFNAQMYMM